jgi:RNA polymerase I-specific transcription initiation factor RRN7
MITQNVEAMLTCFETLVKDLWSLRLQELHSLVSHDAGTDTEIQSSHKFSSQSEGDSGTDTASHRGQGRHRTNVRGPNLLELLAINYIAMLLLRAPVTVADFIKWTNSGQLLYYQASKQVPLTMRNGLSGAHQANFDPQELISCKQFHARILSLVKHFNTRFGMEVPAINHVRILYGWVKQLAFPLEVYVATQRLSRLNGLHFDYAIPVISKGKSLSYPEVRLAVLMIIVIKLIFPLDTTQRFIDSRNALSALHLDWNVWEKNFRLEQEQEDFNDRRPSFERSYNMTEDQSKALSGQALDDYLNWCETELASQDIRRRRHNGDDTPFRRALFDMFPQDASTRREEYVHRSYQASAKDGQRRIEQIQASLRPEQLASENEDGNTARFGTLYCQHKTASELEGPSSTLYTRVAELASYPVPELAKAVFQMESRLGELNVDCRKR